MATQKWTNRRPLSKERTNQQPAGQPGDPLHTPLGAAMARRPGRASLAASLVSAAALAACGGGSGGSTAGDGAPPPPPTPSAVTINAGANGSVTVRVGNQAVQTINAGGTLTLPDITGSNTVELVAMPAGGYRVSGWNLSRGACQSTADPETCQLPGSMFSGGQDLSAAPAYALVPTTLTVTAGRGGSVEVTVAGEASATVAAGMSMAFPVHAEARATLAAMPAAGYAFGGWDGACAGAGAGCALGAALAASTSAEAAFELVPTTLTVAAGRGGSVEVTVAGEASATVAAGMSMAFPVHAEAGATLAAMPAAGYAFGGWDGACAGAGAGCALAGAALAASTSAEAAFELVPTTLTVAAGRGGSVEVTVAGEATATVAAGMSMAFPVHAEARATLAAMPAAGYAFGGWDGVDGERHGHAGGDRRGGLAGDRDLHRAAAPGGDRQRGRDELEGGLRRRAGGERGAERAPGPGARAGAVPAAERVAGGRHGRQRRPGLGVDGERHGHAGGDRRGGPRRRP